MATTDPFTLTIPRGDTVKRDFQFKQGDVVQSLDGLTVTLVVKLPDGTTVTTACPVAPDKMSAQVPIGADSTAQPGVCPAAIKVSGSGVQHTLVGKITVYDHL